MKEREKLGVPSNLDSIFVSFNVDTCKWEPMKESTLSHWAVVFGNTLGVSFYFHCLRHNWTTQLAKENYPPTVIQQLQGWASVDMVSTYDDRDVDDVLSDFFKTKNEKSAH